MKAPSPAAAETAEPSGTRPAGAGNAARVRRRRPEPPRTAPLRHAATLLREAEAAPQAESSSPTGADESSESAVARGVRLGYQVIEEQILLGQKLAQRLGRSAAQAAGSVADKAVHATASIGRASDRGDSGASEVQELLDRVVHLYKDMGSLCVDAVDTLVHHPVLRSSLARMSPSEAAEPCARSAAADGAERAGAARAGAARAEAAAGSGFAVDIRCSRRTLVTLDLPHRSGGFEPRVHALHAADPSLAPLTGVRFGRDEQAGGAAVLQIDIADTQPSAVYTGVVVDAATNEPRGTLSVRLLP
jgi:hypothetical protein